MRLRFHHGLGSALTVAILAVIFASTASPAHADSVCSAGNLSTLIGTTCDIGSLQFTFTGAQGGYATRDFATNTVTEGTPVMPSAFTFTPLADGFELSGVGPQSVTGPSNGEVFDGFSLDFTVTDLNGVITGVGAAGGNLSVSGSHGADAQLGIFAEHGCATCGKQNAFHEVFEIGGTPFDVQQAESGGPTAFEGVSAEPFGLSADDGDTASIDSTDTRFTFNTLTTPEPGTLILLLSGLALLLGLGLRNSPGHRASGRLVI